MAKITAGGITVEFDPTTSSFFIDNNPFDKAGALKKINALEAGIDIEENDKKKLLSFIKKQGIVQTAKPATPKTAPATTPVRVNVADALKANGDIKILFDTSNGFKPTLPVLPAPRKEVFDRLYAQMLLQKDFQAIIVEYDEFNTPAKQRAANLELKVQIMSAFFERQGQKPQGEADLIVKIMKKLNPSFVNPFEIKAENPARKVNFGLGL